MRIFLNTTPDVTITTLLQSLRMEEGKDILRIVGKIEMAGNAPAALNGQPQQDHYAELGVVLTPHRTQADIDAFFAREDVQNRLRQTLALQQEVEQMLYAALDIELIDTKETLCREYTNPLMRNPGF